MAPKGGSGFSLLELMVALVFMGLLLGGMVRVYLAGLDGWNRVGESLKAQRALRWALDRIAEDVRMMGYLFPPPELRALDVAAGADPAQQGAFMLVPGGPGGRSTDEFSFVMDRPLPVRAELAGAIAGNGGEEDGGARAGPATVPVRAARDLRLRTGDLLLVAGERFEFAQVAQEVKLSAGRAGPVAVVRPGAAAGAAFGFRHEAGALVQAVRPLRVVRYAVAPLPLEAGRKGRDAGELVPCLVRFETAYPRDRSVPRWSRFLDPSRAKGGSHEVVAENVSGFQVDFSLDGAFPGIRGADYAATVGNLEAGLQALDGGEPAAARLSDPFWFRGTGGLVKVRLELRSPPPPGAPFARPRLVRGETLLAAPRNAGL